MNPNPPIDLGFRGGLAIGRMHRCPSESLTRVAQASPFESAAGVLPPSSAGGAGVQHCPGVSSHDMRCGLAGPHVPSAGAEDALPSLHSSQPCGAASRRGTDSYSNLLAPAGPCMTAFRVFPRVLPSPEGASYDSLGRSPGKEVREAEALKGRNKMR